MNEYFKDIAFSIIEQAIEDYKLLKSFDVDELDFYDEDTISKSELEEFFNSDWCDFLLLNMNLTGEDILRYLNRE